MTRAEIMEKVAWCVSEWDSRSCIIHDADSLLNRLERAGLVVIPAIADEAEVERVARALCKVKGFDPDANETSACDEGIAWSFWREHEEQATAACAAVREAGKE